MISIVTWDTADDAISLWPGEGVWLVCKQDGRTVRKNPKIVKPDDMPGVFIPSYQNAHYPRLSLAPGQRSASKGGYLARFAEASGTRLVADGDWVVP